MLCKDQYFHNPHFRRVRQGMKQYLYGKAMISRATIDQSDLCTVSVIKLGSCGAVDHMFAIYFRGVVLDSAQDLISVASDFVK